MQNQASRAIFDYWLEVKGDHAAPLRSEIDPAALRHLLPHLFIAASNPQGMLAFRLAGTRICDLFDREFRGVAFAEAWANGDQEHAVEIVRQVIRYETPALVDVLASTSDRSHSYEMLVMPLRATDVDACDRVLGSLLPKGSRHPNFYAPVTNLVMENWTFLTGSPSHFAVPVTTDQVGRIDSLRRLLPGRSMLSGRHS